MVEREASWEITKWRVDWGRAIDVGEAAAAAGEGGRRCRRWGRVAERAGVSSRWDELYF